tara:strand:+ start:516 stop:902 length:387 start_codon:yes stop_codon:yes gene_type:complete
MVSSNIKMFLTFAPPKASPVLYKAVVYEPEGVETLRYMPGPIDKQPPVIFDTIFAKITTIRANIDASIVEVLTNEESYLFYGDIITPESKSISYDNVVRIQSHAEWEKIVRASTSKKTCVAIQAVFGS